MQSFAQRIIAWQRRHGRHGLPWQGADAYGVWLSEIMLQQTQVATVIPYYQRFTARFPDIPALAAAAEDEVLAHWSGLGYYSRARNLHRAARLVAERHGGMFPPAFDDILALPGVGRSTAAAVCALAFHQRHAILDGNVKRVLARYRAVEGHPGRKDVERQLWQHAEALLPEGEVAVYTQGLMDLGATVCTRTRPACGDCPVRQDCAAHASGRTGELPAPRPRKALPEKRGVFLLIRHGSDILLEKRPGHGIWGGLWCFPQAGEEEAEDAAAGCERRFGVEVVRVEALPGFTHVFTHFRLRVEPVLVQVARKPPAVAEPDNAWFEAAAALRAGLPAPVRRLIETLPSGNS